MNGKSRFRVPLALGVALAAVTSLPSAAWLVAQQPPTPSLTPSAAPPATVYVPPQGATGQPYNRQVIVSSRHHLTPADAETAKLMGDEVEAARAAQGLVAQLNAADSEAAKTELKTKLHDALVRQFDAQQKRRAHEIAKIEERLTRLKETMKKRDAAKEMIVDRRIDQLMGVGDELAWEEAGATFVPGAPMNPAAYPSGDVYTIPTLVAPRAPQTAPPPAVPLPPPTVAPSPNTGLPTFDDVEPSERRQSR